MSIFCGDPCSVGLGSMDRFSESSLSSTKVSNVQYIVSSKAGSIEKSNLSLREFFPHFWFVDSDFVI